MQKVISLDEKEIEKIGEAYANYRYPQNDKGMFIFEDKVMLKNYICGFTRACIAAGILYTTSDKHEGYVAITTPYTKYSMKSLFIMAKELIGALGFKNFRKFLKFCSSGGESIEQKMKREKRKCVTIELLVVIEEYQGKGIMRQLMDYAFKVADENKLPCIVDTDEGLKRDKYCHLGVHEVVKREFGDDRYSYGMIRDAV